jgi:hypothetical protein
MRDARTGGECRERGVTGAAGLLGLPGRLEAIELFQDGTRKSAGCSGGGKWRRLSNSGRRRGRSHCYRRAERRGRGELGEAREGREK